MNSQQATVIVQQVADRTGVQFFQIVGDDKHRIYAHARQEAYVALHNAGAGLAQTGRLMQRHHTTVMQGISAALKRQGGGS